MHIVVSAFKTMLLFFYKDKSDISEDYSTSAV